MTIFIAIVIIAAVIIEYLREKKEIYNSEFLSYVRAKMVDGMKVGVIYMVLKIVLYIFGMLFVKKSNA